MPLQPGARLGPYEVTAKIGEGGMGEVYRARDTKLDRDVALKVLPHAFTDDPDRLARFEREAKVLASLNHPHIGGIYGLEESAGVRALVLEYVEGPTLADRIAHGPIPLDEALAIAKQIAEALEAAHERGVIHRDLKPANVKVRADGTVKVLDFGLAKAMEPAGVTPDLSQSPTLTTPAMTQAGVILGTAAYMSPEQAKGKTVDKRSDIWAFGAVLYEMLTGTRAFEAEDVPETFVAVLRADVDWTRLSSQAPPSVVVAIRRCLQKDPKQRIHDVADLRLALDGAFETPGPAPSSDKAVAPRLRVWQRPVPLTIGALALLVVGGLVVWAVVAPSPLTLQRVARFSIMLPSGDAFTNASRHLVALSPDGLRVVYVANNQLYLREMNEVEARPIRGTEGGVEPFFSPDGEWVGFWAAGTLKKIAVTGGTPVTLCEARPAFGASWGADDTILFGQGTGGVLRVAASGGDPEVVIPMDTDQNQRAQGPQLLPDRHTVLLTLTTAPSWDDAQIVAQSLETGERRVVVEGGSDARYVVATGHLVYAVAETLLAVPFDLERLEVIGGAVPVIEDVARGTPGETGAAHVSISDSGLLGYVPDGSLTAAAAELVRVDRQGNASPLTDTIADWESPRFSPDGERLAVRRAPQTGGANQDVWILELSRGTLTRLTFDIGLRPVWSPDGRTVFFSSNQAAGGFNIYSKPADGSGPDVRITDEEGGLFVGAITSDGQTLVFRQGGGQGQMDIGMLRLNGDGEPEMLIQTSFDEHTPKLSPDDRWLAYVSNESGRDEVYVTHFPTGGKWQVSTEGGTEPMWSRNGRELFYRNGNRMMAVPVSPGDEFTPGRPIVLFERPYVLKDGPGATNYDVTPDGEGFVMIRDAGGRSTGPPQQIILVQHWLQELKRLVPVE